jgi:hypothetical protein
LFDQQVAEGPSIVATLPADVQALFKRVEEVSADQAISELFDF